jgi:hypothetical protein
MLDRVRRRPAGFGGIFQFELEDPAEAPFLGAKADSVENLTVELGTLV